jgi:hypothetical protein
MNNLLDTRETLSRVSVGAGLAFTWAGRIVEAAWSFFWRGHSVRDTPPIPMEWDNDVPPFPILTGEVARAEARLPLSTVRYQRRPAAWS